MRKSIIAALLACSAITFPLQTTQSLTPGNGYSDAQRTLITKPGNTSLASQARPEHSSYGQVGLIGDTSGAFRAAQATPNGQLVTPTVSNVPYFSDYLVTFTGFCAAADGTIRDGCTARVTANGSDPIFLTQDTIDVALDSYRGGTRKVPGFKFLLKWTPALAAASTIIEINIELIPTPAMVAQGMAGRLMTIFMTCKSDFDVKAIIDPSATTGLSTTIAYPQSATPQVFKSFTTFMVAAANDQVTHPGWDYYAKVADTVAPGTQFDVTSFNINALSKTTNSATDGQKRTGRTVIDGMGRAVIANINNQTAYVNFNPRYGNLDIQNFTWDLTFIGGLGVGESQYDHMTRFIRCDLHGGPAGRNEVSMITAQIIPSLVVTLASKIIMEQCYLHDMERGDITINCMIGCLMRNMGCDAHNMGLNIPFTFIATDQQSYGDSAFNNPTPILQIAYSGSGTNVGYTITGTSGTTSRTLNLMVDGTVVWSKPASVTKGSGIFDVDQLAADITNNAPGFTVTRTVDSMSKPQLGYACLGFAKTDQGSSSTGDVIGVSNAGTIIPYDHGISVGVQRHTDTMQYIGTGVNHDNILFLSQLISDSSIASLIFLGNAGATNTASNIAILNCGFNNNADFTFMGTTQGQMTANQVGLIVAHVSQPSATLSMRFSGTVGNTPPLTMDKFSRVGKIYCADLAISGMSDTNMQGIIQDIVVTHISNTNGAGSAVGYTGTLDLKYPGSVTSFYLTPSFDTDSFPRLAYGLALPAPFNISTNWQPSDYKPGPLSKLRLPQNMKHPWLPIDGFGNPFNYNDVDMVGCVGLLSATA